MSSQMPEFYVEGWLGLECVNFYRRSLPRAVRSAADHLAIDLGCDRIYVRQGDQVVAEWTPGRGWFGVRIPALSIALEREL